MPFLSCPVCAPVAAYSQSLTYKSSGNSQSPSDGISKLSRLDLEVRKQRGFYHSFETNSFYDGNAVITYDSARSTAQSTARNSGNSQDAKTSSPSTGAVLDIATSDPEDFSAKLSGDSAETITIQDISGKILTDIGLTPQENSGVLLPLEGCSDQTPSLVQTDLSRRQFPHRFRYSRRCVSRHHALRTDLRCPRCAVQSLLPVGSNSKHNSHLTGGSS